MQLKHLKLIFLLFILSCSPRYNDLGWNLFYHKDFDNAIIIFKNNLEKDSTNYNSIKGLAFCYLLTNDYSNAENYIKKGLEINDNDPEIIFSQGVLFSLKNKHKESVETLNKFIEQSTNKELNNIAFRIITQEKKLLFKEEYENLIKNENMLSDLNIEKNTIALLPFKNIGQQGDFNVLERGIADQTITYLGYIRNIKVLERLRIEELFKEINLSNSEMIDKTTANRTGKLLKAEKLLTGNYKVNKDTISLNMFYINVVDGNISEELKKKGRIENFFDIHRELLLESLDKMKISINDDDRKKIITFKTENIFEFITYLKKKYLEESESLIVSGWILNRIDELSSSPIDNITNVSQISNKLNFKSTIIPLESPELEMPPSLPK